MKKHYLVYKTTCLVNGKIYIGQHQTYDPNDNYLGSGRDLKEDIRKFGSENLKRELLFDFESQKEMDDKEKELVTEEFINREDTYNLRLGGQNDCLSDINSIARKKFYELIKTDKKFKEHFSNKLSAVVKRLRREHPERYFTPHNDGTCWYGKHHTDETKKKIGCKNSVNLLGENNGRYGQQWVSDTINEITYPQDKSIPLEDFQLPIRIMNYDEYRVKVANKQMEQITKNEYKEKLRQIQRTFFSAFYDEYLKNGFNSMCSKFGLTFELSAFLHLCKKRVPYYETWKRIKNGDSHKSSA